MDQHPDEDPAADGEDADAPTPEALGAGASRAALRGSLRARSRRHGAADAHDLREIAALVAQITADARHRLAASPRVSSQPDDAALIRSAVVGEVMAVLGLGDGEAAWMIDLATRLTRVLTATLHALETGRINLGRARTLADATEVCTDQVARQVETLMLGAAGDAPWDGLSPRNFRARLDRAIVKADPGAARTRRERARVEREVRTWPDRDGLGVVFMRTGIEDVILTEQVISGLVHGSPTHDRHGTKLSMAQRRVEVVMDIIRRIRDGAPPPHLPVRREREVGLVLHTDTLFGHGPAAEDPGELRGLGSPAPLDPDTARQSAREQIAHGAGTCVFLTDTHGNLQRLVRLMLAPDHGWTPDTLTAAVREALPDLPVLRTDSYPPTVAITEHVHARNPRCTSLDCARIAARSDLDHDQPWPRGPTHPDNLHPRCRRHHELKTRGLIRTNLQPDGTVHTRMLTGLTVTTRPEPLPGHAPGEGYGAP